SVSLLDQAAPALQVLALPTTVWPALLFIVPVTACCSIFVTHRLMGPLDRIEGAAKALTRGNLDLRIRLRKGDDLQALACFMNEAVDNLVQAIRVIKESETSVREILS